MSNADIKFCSQFKCRNMPPICYWNSLSSHSPVHATACIDRSMYKETETYAHIVSCILVMNWLCKLISLMTLMNLFMGERHGAL